LKDLVLSVIVLFLPCLMMSSSSRDFENFRALTISYLICLVL